MNDLPVTVPTIPPPSVKVFYKGKFVKLCNEYELNDIRIQINKGKLEGFTVFEELTNSFINIDSFGRLSHWPCNLDLMCKQLMQL